jgi:CheY-like chemotaxis protein
VSQQIVIFEDEYFDREHISQLIGKRFPKFGMRLLGTEAEFHSVFPELCEDVPVLVMLGMRAKWTHPAPEMPEPPAEVLAGTYREAGLRCWRMLRQNPNTSRVPVIFWTTIDETGTGKEALTDPLTTFVEMDVHDDRIVSAVGRALRKA